MRTLFFIIFRVGICIGLTACGNGGTHRQGQNLQQPVTEFTLFKNSNDKEGALNLANLYINSKNPATFDALKNKIAELKSKITELKSKITELKNQTAKPTKNSNPNPVEKTYQIKVSLFMTKSRMPYIYRNPLLEVSKSGSRSYYRLLHHDDCVEVKESDFEDLDLKVIFFTRNPIDICGQYSNEKCSPAHYGFSAGSSHGFRGEVIKKIPAENSSDFPIIVSKRTDYPYSSGCYVFGS